MQTKLKWETKKKRKNRYHSDNFLCINLYDNLLRNIMRAIEILKVFPRFKKLHGIFVTKKHYIF